MMPHAGGQYVYLREAYSPLWGFLYGWTCFLVIQTGSIAAVARRLRQVPRRARAGAGDRSTWASPKMCNVSGFFPSLADLAPTRSQPRSSSLRPM